MLKYIIVGLPRSGTTWLSHFLSIDECQCLHDPSAFFSKQEMSLFNGGLCDTGLWFDMDWCREKTRKLIVIERPIEDVNKSLTKLKFPLVTKYFYERFMKVKGLADYIIYFDSLFVSEDEAREFWEFVYPEIPFDKDRWKELSKIKINSFVGD